jgi:uracil-DNA glycosylase
MSLFVNISNDWKKLLDNTLLKDTLAEIDKSTNKDDLCPSLSNIFEFARKTPLHKVKVVFMAQSPYSKKGLSTGLAFSSHNKCSSSLKNIFLSLMNNKLIDSIPKDGNLDFWAKQGVLLLNASLTTEVNKSNKHHKLWHAYMKNIIIGLSEYFKKKDKKIVFVLFGKFSQKFETSINDYHKIFKTAHPSPNSQVSLKNKDKLENSDLFIKINKYIDNAIDWDIVKITPIADKSAGDTSIGDISLSEISFRENIIEDNIKSKLPELNINYNFDDDILKFFTDASATNNGKKNCVGGYAAICVSGYLKNLVLIGKLNNSVIRASNIRGEGTAILSVLKKLDIKSDKWKNCIIYTDSQFWVSMVYKYMPTWDSVKFKSKSNPDLTEEIWNIWNKINLMKNVEITYVPAHNKNNTKDSKDPFEKYTYDNNDAADILASFALNLYDFNLIEFYL